MPTISINTGHGESRISQVGRVLSSIGVNTHIHVHTCTQTHQRRLFNVSRHGSLKRRIPECLPSLVYMEISIKTASMQKQLIKLLNGGRLSKSTRFARLASTWEGNNMADWASLSCFSTKCMKLAGGQVRDAGVTASAKLRCLTSREQK